MNKEKIIKFIKSDLAKKWYFYASLIVFAGIVLHVVLSLNFDKLHISGDVEVTGYMDADVSGNLSTSTNIEGYVDVLT